MIVPLLANLQVTRTHKNLGRIQFLARSTYLFQSYLSAKHISSVVTGKFYKHDSAYIFDQIFLKFAVNQDMHKVLDNFDFRPDQTIHFGVTHPRVPKKIPIELYWGK